MNKKGINISNLDVKVSPKENFYNYACGGWIASHPLPEEFARFGTFDMLRENARLQLKDLILGLGDDPDAKVKDTLAQKIFDLYSLGMDEERLNAEGAEPIIPFLEKVKSFTKDRFTDFMVWLHDGLSSAFFGTGVGVDTKDSDKHLFHIGETGLSLGDRDYYLEKNETNDKILKGFEIYVKKIMTLAGFPESDAERIWNTVIKLETEIARHKLTREERRNPQLLYNIFSIDEIKEKYGNIVDWNEYFNQLKVWPEKVNVTNPRFLDYLNQRIPELTDQEIKDYLFYEIVSDASSLLSDDFEDADFEMFEKLMSGVEEKKPRWKRAMALPNSMFGEAIGELYVKKYFPEANKEYMKGLVENLRKSLGRHITQLSWMSADTKQKALEKLEALKVKIGYPDKWKDYSDIHIDPSKSYWENVYRASMWVVRDNYSKLGKPVDKEEWHMYPQTVNAYYSPVSNEICFPAAILQPPYFNPEADDAMNYGAIGVVIGHEMTHGFDDQGRQFDKKGNLSNWWKDEDEKRFNSLADKLVELFDKVEVSPGVYANGRFTLGENIADQGGLRVALTAYLDTLDGKESKEIDGFSALQRFYISYAGVWASSIRDEEILVCTKSDPHSLSINRVNETLKNIDEFFNAFHIKEGDKMFRPSHERIVIW